MTIKMALGATAIAGAVIAVTASPPAHANADGYLRCVNASIGGDVPATQALALGRTISQALAIPNGSRTGLINRIYANGTNGFSLTEVESIVECVEHNQPL